VADCIYMYKGLFTDTVTHAHSKDNYNWKTISKTDFLLKNCNHTAEKLENYINS